MNKKQSLSPDMNGRYARHIALNDFGEQGQEKLKNSTVLLVGLGGLGSPIAMYLAASGVGHIILNDFDHVDESNLQRQIVHPEINIGQDKVISAATTLCKLNTDIKISTINWVLEDEELLNKVSEVDVVIDASDNFETRFNLNRASIAGHKPLVFGAAIRYEGQVSVFDPRIPTSPCYNCLYEEVPGSGESCAQLGVFAPLLGIVGSIQSAEVLKLLLEQPHTLVGRVINIDSRHQAWRELKLNRDPACPSCGQN